MTVLRKHVFAQMTFVVCLSGPAAAMQDISATETIRFTLNEAVGVALLRNPVLLEQREQTTEFDYLVRQARAEALPQVNTALGLSRSRDPGLRNSPFFSQLLEDPNSGFDESSARPFFFSNYLWQFQVEQPIYTFGRVSNALTAAREELDGVALDVLELENSVSRDVVVALYGYLLAQRQLTVLETEQRARERQLSQVQDRFELEDATRLDVLRAQVALANVKPELLSAQNDLNVSRALVNDTLGRPVEAPFEVIAELEIPDPYPSVPSVSELLDYADAHRPQLLRFIRDKNVLDARAGVSRSNLKPSINANVTYGINTFKLDNLKDWAFRSWTFGVSMDWTLFDGFRTPSEVGVLRSQRTQKDLEASAFRSSLSLQLKRSTGDLNRTLETVRTARQAVELAREAQRVAEQNYQWGAATVLDVLESERALRESEFNLAQAGHDTLVAVAELKYLVGVRFDEPLPFLN